MSKLIKVCHIAHGDLWAGAEVQLATLLAALVSDSRFELSAILFNEGRLAREIGEVGVPLTVIPESSHSSPSILWKMVAHLKRIRPNVIHTHKYKDNVLGAMAAVIAGVPKVVRSIHGMTEPFEGMAYLRMKGYETLDRLVSRTKVSRLIAVSSNIQTELDRIYGAGRAVRIHNGINLKQIQIRTDRESVRRNLGIQPDQRVVGTVGRLTPVKGHEILLRMARLLSARMGGIRVLIVGEGPLRARLMEARREMGIEKEVIFAGHREDVYDLLNCMDVFVLPSLHEGIPMVLLEALALRLPVVASCVGGIPEVIQNLHNGILVAPCNPYELERSVSRVLHDKDLASQLGTAGRARIEGEFTDNIMAKKTGDLYELLVA